MPMDCIEKLVRHYELIVKWNKRVNLTRITSPKDAARNHFAESLLGLQEIDPAKKVVDLGSGAGFPVIPLAAARPDIEFTAIEANRKKAIFLLEVKDALALHNFSVVPGRIEESDLSDYDLITSRALDNSKEMLSRVLRSLAIHQRLMLYCGNNLLSSLASNPAGISVLAKRDVPGSDNRLLVVLARRA